MTSLIEVIDDIKTAAEDSGLINMIKLVKHEDDMKNIFRDADFRALYIIITDADILTDDDYYGISLTIMDKAPDYTDDGYINSLMGGIAALRIISDKLNYSNTTSASVDYDNIDIISGKDKDRLITVVSADIKYAIDPVPNIHIDD